MLLSRREVLAAGVAGVALKPENPLVGGTVLRRAAIQSPNFVTGVSGWTINQDGSAEFNNVTVRGTVIASHFVGNGQGQEILIYSGPPAQGNLIASVVSAAGTDSHNNNFLAGVTDYSPAGGNSRATQLAGGFVQSYTALASNGPWTLVSSVGVTVADALDLTLSVIGTGARLVFANGSGLTGSVSGSKLANVTTVTVTQAAFTSLFNDTIPANDAVVGATYKATAFGFGQWGSTNQDLFFAIRFGATDATTIGTNPDISSAAFAANALFRWEAEAILTCVTTGATAHWVATIRGCVTETALSILPGTAGNNTVPFVGGTGSGTVTLDSTVNELFGISAHWGATVGAPTLTSVAGRLERVA